MEQKDSFEPAGNYILHNTMEDHVIEKTKAIVSKMDMCQCEKCFIDICAMVLNKTAPVYVTTTKGTLMAKIPHMDQAKELALTVLITQTAKMVMEKPMH